MVVRELSEKTFDKFVRDENAIVDFWAEWCGPCKILSPVVDAISKEFDATVKFGKVDVDKETELAQRFGVRSIPTLIFFKKGEEADRTVGALGKEELRKKLEETF